MATILNVIITDAGIQEVINAEHDGTAPVRLAQVGFGRGIYTPSATQTALQDEIKRVDTIAGGVVGDNIMHIQALDGQRGDAYAVYEIGVYTESGTLFAIYSQTLPIIYKVADSEIMCVIDFVLAGFEPTSVTVGDTNYTLAPATTSNQGVVELATNEEAVAGTDAERALTPASGAAAIDDKVAAHAALLAAPDGTPGHFSFRDTGANTGPFSRTEAGEFILNAIYMRNNYVTTKDAQTISVPKTFTGGVTVLKLLSTADGSQIGTDEAPFTDVYAKNLNSVEGLYFNDTTSEIRAGASDPHEVGEILCSVDYEHNGNIRLTDLSGSTQSIYIAEAATHAVAMDDSDTGVSCPVGSVAFVRLSTGLKARGVSVEIGETFSVTAGRASIVELTSSGFLTGARYLPAGTYKAFCKITFTGEAGFFDQPIFVQRVG